MPLKASKMMIPMLLGSFRSRHRSPIDMFPNRQASKVLLVKQSERLGNIVLMNSAIMALAKTQPDIKIDLLLPAPYAEIMAANSNINAVIPVYKREYIFRPWQLAGLIRKLRRTRYDLAIDCSDVNSHSSTGAMYTMLSGALYTAGWKMIERRTFDIEIDRYSEVIHATMMYLRLFSKIFGKVLDGQPYFNHVPQIIDKSVIGINCGGRGTKRWSIERFVKVGKDLSRLGFEIEFILGPEENGLRNTLQLNLPKGCRLLPLLSLKALMNAIASYKVFISSDTGPMHLAWCLQVPTIAIFLDSEIEKFKPLSPDSIAIDGKSGVDPETIVEIAAKIANSGKVKA